MPTQHWLYTTIRRLSLAVCGLLLVWPQAATAYPATTISLATSPSASPAPQSVAGGVTAIAAGYYHTCALMTGGVKCWGLNDYGQLGDGTTAKGVTVVNVVGLARSVIAISAGADYTCALTTTSGVKCWGQNNYGQLGDGTTTNRSTPVDVVGLTRDVVAIAAGDLHNCALTTSGGVKCWGYNGFGQLGDGTITSRLTPVDVVSLISGVVAIAVGDSHTCALTTGGGIKCWGANGQGQLGNGTPTTPRLTAVDVVGLIGNVVGIAVGDSHTCALTTAGGLKCWGDFYRANSYTPVDLVGLTSGVTAIASRGYHTCVLTTVGGVKCWGVNYYGQLGDGTQYISDEGTGGTQRGRGAAPVDVVGLSRGVSAITAGYSHTCALLIGGGVKCWGYDRDNQLGDETVCWTICTTAVDVKVPSSGISAVAAGKSHTCVLIAGGVKCWGLNAFGEVGDGTTTQRTKAVDVVGLTSGVRAVIAGFDHTCALTTDGGVKCWGWNLAGQLGDGTTTNRLTPVDVVGLTSGASAITAAFYHTCALLINGGVKCWGENWAGQLGDGTTINRLTAVDVAGLTSGVSAIAAGNEHTCALMTSGGVKCWGWNANGQVGDGTGSIQVAPVDVVGLTSGVSAIAAGESHTCALTTSGGVKCWGMNSHGQVGDGTITDHLAPVDVMRLTSGISAIAAGFEHTCALTTGGGVKCWGQNASGQLGDGTRLNHLTEVDVVGLAGISAIATGREHMCALTTGGRLKCWGQNANGQLGVGIGADFRALPVDVVGLTGGADPGDYFYPCVLTMGRGLRC